MATGPTTPTTPLELLTNDGSRPEPYINKFWGPAIGGAVFFVVSVVSKLGRRKPLMSGIQTHILITGAGAVIGKYLDDYRTWYLAERDAVLRHYIELHPDDFPAYERKKFSEVLERWIPIR